MGGNLASRKKWKFNGSQIETVNGFTYVGIHFTYRLSFSKMAEAVAAKAKKVAF